MRKEDGDTYDFQSMTFAKDSDEEFETNGSSLTVSTSFIVVHLNPNSIFWMKRNLENLM